MCMYAMTTGGLVVDEVLGCHCFLTLLHVVLQWPHKGMTA